MKYALLFATLVFSATASAEVCPQLLDRTITTLQGEKINLCQYAGKPILVVNTASKCGYTPQFEQLEAMYGKYKQQGLLVIGFPSNDFRQEFSDKGEIAKFCKLTYKVKFPMSEPSSVSGKNANSFFKALAKSTGEAPSWNFHKYLIETDGKTVHSFATSVEPDSPEIMDKIQAMLK
ncbi:MAG: glutathione peroxidase [Sideroxydans sp.]|nr:glutathione peroxidase [Sideroxydans sp.]